MKKGWQILIRHLVDGQYEWGILHPTHGKPYVWETSSKATDAKNRLYPLETIEWAKIKEVEVPDEQEYTKY